MPTSQGIQTPKLQDQVVNNCISCYSPVQKQKKKTKRRSTILTTGANCLPWTALLLHHHDPLLQCQGKWSLRWGGRQTSPHRLLPCPLSGKDSGRIQRIVQRKRKKVYRLHLAHVDSQIHPAEQRHNPSGPKLPVRVILTLGIISMSWPLLHLS